MFQKISFPHIVDKVVNNIKALLHIVYNSFFAHFVFYLDNSIIFNDTELISDNYM